HLAHSQARSCPAFHRKCLHALKFFGAAHRGYCILSQCAYSRRSRASAEPQCCYEEQNRSISKTHRISPLFYVADSMVALGKKQDRQIRGQTGPVWPRICQKSSSPSASRGARIRTP